MGPGGGVRPPLGIGAIHVDGSHVTTRLTVTGTHREEHAGPEPTGESFEISAATVCRGEGDFAGLPDRTDHIDVPVSD